jgi:1,4-dihydroxy-2-naphthoyl-CoA synthase
VPEYNAITYDLADGVARITLNRPEAFNEKRTPVFKGR